MKLVEIERIFNPDEFMGFPFNNEMCEKNVTMINFREIPVLMQLVKDIIQKIVDNKMNLHYTKEELLERIEFQGQTYTGDIVSYHYDSYPEDSRSLDPWGQRNITGLVYLNDNFDGGLTYFPKINKYIKPEKGKMVLFTSVHEDLTLDKESIHCATAVSNGNKSILNVWFRENPVVIKNKCCKKTHTYSLYN